MDREPQELPFDRMAPPAGDGLSRRAVRDLAKGTARLESVAALLGRSPSEVVMLAWALVLSRYTHRQRVDLVVVANDQLGHLVVDADPVLPFRVVTERSALSVPNDSYAGAARTVFMLDGADLPATLPPAAALALGLDTSGSSAALVADYSVRFDSATAERMLDHVVCVVDSVAHSSGNVSVAEIDILPPAELAQLAAWNATEVDYPADATLASLFSAAVTRWPEAIALEFAGRQLTYAELDGLVQRVAARLAAEGIARGDLVGVLAERSVELVAALHGVVRAGGGYVPLDPEYPAERIAYMVAETGMRVVLGQARFGTLLTDPDVTLLDLEALLDPATPAPVGPAPSPPTPDDVAYVIYTSGSTGRPKGVANGHRGVVNQMQWLQDRFTLAPGNVMLQKTPFSFDVSLAEFFWPLQVGARLVVAEPGGHRDPAYLVETVRRLEVDTIQFVPSMLRMFLDHPAAASCTSLRRVICAGEALTRDLVERCFTILPQAELHNLYGPTETAIHVTAWQCRRDDPQLVVPIGAPIANTTIHILDDRLRPVPIGIPGELFIGGVQVAHGYVNRPDLTAERFVADPIDPPGRLYRTGDLARWLPSGQVEFLGRLDQQVKLRGQRIELGEIEATLGEHPAVLEAAVTLAQSGDDARLVAHLIARDGTPIDVADVRDHLKRTLPAYMLPSAFVVLEHPPLTASGKLDRASLPAPEPTAAVASDYVAPRTGLEIDIAEMWSEVLADSNIGVETDFFDLGGHSLKLMQLATRMEQQFGVRPSLTSLFASSTVAAQALLVTEELILRDGATEEILKEPAAADASGVDGVVA